MESYLVYFLTRAVIALARTLPRPAITRFSNLCAALTYLADPKHRRIAQVNLRIAFPEMCSSERHRIARESFKNTARNVLEIARLSTLTPGRISRLVGYNTECGLNNLQAAQSGGNGILYITGHFSAWELLPTAHALHGYPLSFVTRPLDNPLIERYMLRVREASGNRVISKKNAARQILETLKFGGSVGILMDQNTDPQEGIFVDFFGIPACTTASVALIALRTSAPVVPGYLTPLTGGRYQIKFLPAVELIRTGDKSRDVRANTRRFNRILEQIIREQPETWLWGHKRWWYQPPGNPSDLYRLPERELESFLLRVSRAPQSESESDAGRPAADPAGEK